MRWVAVILASLSYTIAAHAHHSTAEYDRTGIHEIEGVLADVRWRNPHVVLTVRVGDAAENAVDWELASGAVYALERSGLVESAFTLGDRVRVAGWRSTERPSAMLVTNLLLPSGEEVLFSAVSENRWSSEVSGGRWRSEPVERPQRGLFRVWSVADLATYARAVRGVDIRLTDSARARMTAPPHFDPCVPQGMPAMMLNPLPVEFVDRGETIELRLTPFAIVRTIHVTDAPDPATVPLSDGGHSVGRWTGDALEVRTTRVGWPYVDDGGRPQTERVEILERFALVDEGNRLSYTQTVVDPASFTEPVRVSWDWIDIGEEGIEPLYCE